MATDYIESEGVKDVVGVKLIGANSQIVDSATLAEQQAQTALLDLIKQNTTGLVKNDKEIPFVWFLVKQAFTDVTVDDLVVAYAIINTETGAATSYTKRWRGFIDVTVPSPITDYLVPTGGNPMTLAQFQLVFGNTSDAAATDPTASSTAIQLFKGIFSKVDFTRTAVQNIAVTASSTQSSAFNANTKRISIRSTEADCWVIDGANPTASIGGANCWFIPAGSIDYPITVTAGHKLAVIAAVAAGYLNIIELQ